MFGLATKFSVAKSSKALNSKKTVSDSSPRLLLRCPMANGSSSKYQFLIMVGHTHKARKSRGAMLFARFGALCTTASSNRCAGRCPDVVEGRHRNHWVRLLGAELRARLQSIGPLERSCHR